MHESSKCSKTAIGLCLFLDREIPLFYQQYKARDVQNSKPIGHRMTRAVLKIVHPRNETGNNFIVEFDVQWRRQYGLRKKRFATAAILWYE